MKSSGRCIQLLAIVVLITAVDPVRARAFCGFYVAGTEQPLYNDATMVVLAREGTH